MQKLPTMIMSYVIEADWPNRKLTTGNCAYFTKMDSKLDIPHYEIGIIFDFLNFSQPLKLILMVFWC